MAVDPSYPMLPIAYFLSSIMLLLVLLTNFVRQKWNFSVTLLSFWLFVECLTYGINTIVWADNFDLKLWVYCDIGMFLVMSCRSRETEQWLESVSLTDHYFCG